MVGIAGVTDTYSFHTPFIISVLAEKLTTSNGERYSEKSHSDAIGNDEVPLPKLKRLFAASCGELTLNEIKYPDMVHT